VKRRSSKTNFGRRLKKRRETLQRRGKRIYRRKPGIGEAMKTKGGQDLSFARLKRLYRMGRGGIKKKKAYVDE